MLYSNPSFLKSYEQEIKQEREAGKRHEEEIRQREEEKKFLQRRIADLKHVLNESRASHKSIVSENASLKYTMRVEQERREQSNRAMTENAEKNRQREIELDEKLKSKDLRIKTMAENFTRTEKTASLKIGRLQFNSADMTKKLKSKQQRVDTLTEMLEGRERNETTLRQKVEELEKGREEDRARGEKEKRSLATEMTKKLESKQQRVDALTEILGEKERNETTLKQQVGELKKRREEDKARGEKEKRSLAAEMTKKLESVQHRVDTLTEIVWEKERNETTLKQQVGELKKGREEDRARGEREKRSLAAEMTKKLESKQQRVDALTEILVEKERNETTLRQHVEDLKKGGEEDRARFENEKRSVELSWKKGLDYKEQNIGQLERETWKLRTKLQLESEIRSAEHKKKAETHQWSFIPWLTSGKQAQRGITSSGDNSRGELDQSERSNASQAEEEPTNDDFANILKQIADDLSEEAKIDSLGSQLGIIQGDIARALKTNMRYEQVTSRGTHLMLIQWREGVSREDERIELRRALVAAKLLDLANRYVPQGKKEGNTVNGHRLEIEDSRQHSEVDNSPSAQRSSEGQTSPKEPTAPTGRPHLHGQSSESHGEEASECVDKLSEVVSNHSTDGVHGTHGGGLTGQEHPQKIGEVPGSSGGQNKTNKPTATTIQTPDDTSPKNQREEASEGMDQHSEESSINNIADDVQETSVDVSSNEPFDEGTSISDERGVEYTTINYGDLLSNIALTETSSEKLLMLLFMKVIIDIPFKEFGR
ncbi:trichohyalin-like [Strongylocentrotus purpuratus]|uniref:Uncharacterized protein n=1 Tax=Strongylocentrotus purpuratus TaxID=7668 RepID=A0A7M7HJJ0_STRPU|nr:trichohyalin-like [Strongylocentrotus purpuratus]